MAFHYREVVPWGRSHGEYLRMFALGEADLRARILGCGDGPASFNAGMARRGRRVVSLDPLYRLGAAEIARRIDATFEEVMGQTAREQHRFVWTQIRSVDELGRVRMRAMRQFLADYPEGRRRGRYVAGALPALPFRSGQFELAICSHLLFFYAEQLSLELHLASLRELCRVAAEVRVFPLVDVNARPSAHLPAALDALTAAGVRARIEPVPYEFQRGADRMLRLSEG